MKTVWLLGWATETQLQGEFQYGEDNVTFFAYPRVNHVYARRPTARDLAAVKLEIQDHLWEHWSDFNSSISAGEETLSKSQFRSAWDWHKHAESMFGRCPLFDVSGEQNMTYSEVYIQKARLEGGQPSKGGSLRTVWLLGRATEKQRQSRSDGSWDLDVEFVAYPSVDRVYSHRPTQDDLAQVKLELQNELWEICRDDETSISVEDNTYSRDQFFSTWEWEGADDFVRGRCRLFDGSGYYRDYYPYGGNPTHAEIHIREVELDAQTKRRRPSAKKVRKSSRGGQGSDGQPTSRRERAKHE